VLTSRGITASCAICFLPHRGSLRKTLQDGKLSFRQSEIAQAARSGSSWRRMPFCKAVKPPEIVFSNQNTKDKGFDLIF